LNDVLWINEINNLLDTILGEDALHYEYDAKNNCIVSQEDEPLHVYDHEKWELELEKRMNSTPLSENVHETEEQKPKKPQTKRTKPQTKRCLFPSNAVPQPAQPAQPAPSTLRLCISPTVTREDLADIVLPDVDPYIRETDVDPVFANIDPSDLTDPFTLAKRPPEAAVKTCVELMNTCRSQIANGNVVHLDDSGDPLGVTMGHLGTFDSEGIKVLEAYCSVKNMQRDYKEEMLWLISKNQSYANDIDEKDIEQLRDVFQSSLFDPMRVIVSLDSISIDFKSLSTLVGERYIDNFVINYCLRKTWNEASIDRQKAVICLPNEAFQWLQSDIIDPIEDIFRRDINAPQCLELIVIPLYMHPFHWGIICVDLKRSIVWFDDGMSRRPPSDTCLLMGRLVEVLANFCPIDKSTNQISTSVIKRMGMPQQTAKGIEGSGSCGMGVIRTGQNIIHTGEVLPTTFSWNYGESSFQRKKLLLYILSQQM